MADEQTFTVTDQTPDSEVLTEEEQDSLDVGEKLVAEQENLLAGKYKSAEELEKAYKELEAKLGDKSEQAEQKQNQKLNQNLLHSLIMLVLLHQHRMSTIKTTVSYHQKH